MNNSNEWNILDNRWRKIRNYLVHNEGIVKENDLQELLPFLVNDYSVVEEKHVKRINLTQDDLVEFMLLAQKVLVLCIK